jgi:hypothetical protein
MSIVGIQGIVPSSKKTTFTPASQVGLLGWGRADVGITQSGGLVSAWADQSGNGSNMVVSAGSTTPAFIASSAVNGQPAVRMRHDATNAWMTGTLGSHFSGQHLTVIAIGNLTNAGRVFSMVPTGGADTDANAFTLFQSDNVTISLYNNGIKSSVTTADRTSGLNGVYSGRFDGTNGTARATGVDGTPGADTTTFSLDNFWFVGGAGAPFDVCEWAIIDHALSSTEWTQWSIYTNTRYGLSA